MPCDNCDRLRREVRELREELAEYDRAPRDDGDLVLAESLALKYRLTPQSGKVLAALVERAGRLSTLEFLALRSGYDGIGQNHDKPPSRSGPLQSVRVCMSRIRKSVPVPFQNVRGKGYVLSAEAAAEIRK